mmetsp:Transcript_20781/g.46531  ORF Transcript_20781/g.46531 Transcript_20781/m.46531 type:complete len:295 (-) Transcript_20781:707-1591(-)
MWFATLKAHTHSALIGPFLAKETRGRCDHGSCRTSETKSEHATDTMYATQARRSTLHSHTPARNHPQAPEVPVVNRTRTTHKSPKREGARMHFADDRWDASPLSDKPESMRTRCSHSAHTLGCDECATVEASSHSPWIRRCLAQHTTTNICMHIQDLMYIKSMVANCPAFRLSTDGHSALSDPRCNLRPAHGSGCLPFPALCSFRAAKKRARRSAKRTAERPLTILQHHIGRCRRGRRARRRSAEPRVGYVWEDALNDDLLWEHTQQARLLRVQRKQRPDHGPVRRREACKLIR